MSLDTANLLEAWGLTAEELSEIIAANPSMRGLVFGFVAEYRLQKGWLECQEIKKLTSTNLRKFA